MTNENEEWVSKTAKKRQMNDLQDLGMELTKLAADTLKKIGLPDDLYDAVREYKKMSGNGAIKRQSQYIGRLMRDVDPEPIRIFLAKLNGDNQAYNAFLQRVEQMRVRLLENDEELTGFVAAYPNADVSLLRTLIRNTRKEKELNKPPKHFRALYQAIKAVMESEINTNEMSISAE